MRLPFRLLALFPLAILAFGAPASADNTPMCAEIPKGNVAACKARVAKQCTDSDNWARHVCEGRVAEGFNECRGDAASRASERARAIVQAAKRSQFQDDGPELDAWLAHAPALESNAAEYANIDKGWRACGTDSTSGLADEDARVVRGAVEAYRKEFTRYIDRVIDDAQASMKPDAKGKPGYALEDFHLKKVQRALAIEPRVPAAWRYREADLKAALAQSDTNAVARAALIKAETAKRGCPAGKPLAKPWLAVARAEYDGDPAKRRTFRQTLPRRQTLEGLITVDSVPVAMCAERASQTAGAPNVCEYTNLTVYREKAPGAPWTSWRLAVGGGDDFNCKKF